MSKFTPSLKLNSSGTIKKNNYSSYLIRNLASLYPGSIFKSDEIINYGFEWKTQWLPENRDSKNLLMVDSEPDNIEEIDDIINTYFKDETYFLKFYKDT